jgi:diaminohydroxyphosphoribosylaminopyrimidine deaminase/5-amino-6-(5-phosphoribosylamino)uracil reductase
VEGGAKTLNTFLADGLWDEIRVETHLKKTVSDGTRAPLIPSQATTVSVETYDTQQIIRYHKIIPES